MQFFFQIPAFLYLQESDGLERIKLERRKLKEREGEKGGWSSWLGIFDKHIKNNSERLIKYGDLRAMTSA